ncbi:MAG: sugar phosphate isomerase/epimerase [Lentisphaerae bacterium]|nr:sugar phosphate isomerase/epimerase [Lentisphaerota bacterium]
MKFVLFSKHWPGLSVAEMIARTQAAGADGMDLAVRAGMAVNPENVTTALPAALREVRAAGLDIPMVTTEGNFIDPTAAASEQLAAAMAEAGVKIAKLGYWPYRVGETPYWETVTRIRRALEGFEALARRFGITFCYHTHSDYFGLNAGSMITLLRDRDPRYIGAYLDTGHLYYCGEPFAMAADIASPYLTLVSFKDTFFKRQNPATEELPVWRRTIVPAGHGVVRWPDVMKTLRRVGFDGTASVHCEFTAPTPEEFAALQKREVAFLRQRYADAAS